MEPMIDVELMERWLGFDLFLWNPSRGEILDCPAICECQILLEPSTV
jgi:hypothetical protein